MYSCMYNCMYSCTVVCRQLFRVLLVVYPARDMPSFFILGLPFSFGWCSKSKVERGSQMRLEPACLPHKLRNSEKKRFMPYIRSQKLPCLSFRRQKLPCLLFRRQKLPCFFFRRQNCLVLSCCAPARGEGLSDTYWSIYRHTEVYIDILKYL